MVVVVVVVVARKKIGKGRQCFMNMGMKMLDTRKVIVVEFTSREDLVVLMVWEKVVL